MRPLLWHQWRRHRVVLAVVMGGLCLFEYAITRLAPAPDQAQQLGALMSGFLPRPMLDALGIDPEQVTTRGVLGFGYVHPFVLLLFALWTVRVGATSLAGEIGAGTMDLIASRPVERRAIVASAALSLLGGLLAGALAAWCGTALGLATRDLGDIRATEYAAVAAGAGMLFAAFGGVALLVSAFHRTGGGAIGVVSGLMAATFALDYVARAWRPIGWMRPVSPFAHFEPAAVFRDGLVTGHLLWLGTLAVVGLVGSLVVFGRRDL